MTSVIERAARALHAAHMKELGPLRAWTWEEATKAYYHKQARAVLEAIGYTWRPIESAPKDGSYVDLWCAPLDESGTALTPCRIPNCYWVEDYSAWYAVSLRGEPIRVWHRVTHWRPEYSPPEAPDAALREGE